MNVLLLGAYVGTVRGQVLSPEDLDAIDGRIGAWRDEVVRPLRAIRRRLKTGPAPAPDSRTDTVRSAVAKAELDAELIELDELGAWVDGLVAPAAPGRASERARSAMDVVVRGVFPGSLGEHEDRALQVIAQAASAHGEVDA